MIYWLVRAQPLFSFPLAQTVRGEPITLSHCGYVLCHLQTLDRDTFTPTTNGWKLKNSDTRRFQNLIPQPLSGGTVLTAKQDIRSWQNNLTTFKSCSPASFGVCPSCHEIVDPWRDCFAHLYFQGQEWTLCKPLIQHGWKVLELFRKKNWTITFPTQWATKVNIERSVWRFLFVFLSRTFSMTCLDLWGNLKIQWAPHRLLLNNYNLTVQ